MMYCIHDLDIHVAGEFDPGIPEKPILIFLHGFTLSSQEWVPLFDYYKRDFQPVAIDIIGHGKSSSPDDESKYTFGFFAEVLNSLLREMGVASAHWIGYSLGSRLLLYFALQNPQYVRSAILEGTTPGIRNSEKRSARRERDEALAQFIEKNSIETFSARWTEHPIFDSQKKLPAESLEYMKSIRLKNSSRGLANNLRQMGRGSMPPLWNDLEKLSVPALLLAGELDPKHVKIVEQMQALIPDCETRFVQNAGHNIHFERPDKFADITLDFLRRH